jgi:hypothetical protein
MSDRLGGVHRLATADADDHARPFPLRDSSEPFDLTLGAFAAERLLDHPYSGFLEGPLGLLLSHELPHRLVGDHERVLAELRDVLPDGGQEIPSLDVLLRGDQCDVRHGQLL